MGLLRDDSIAQYDPALCVDGREHTIQSEFDQGQGLSLGSNACSPERLKFWSRSIDSSVIIAAKAVSKSFDGGRTQSVIDLDLDVRPGEFLVLLGESGSGKTTTLKMLNGLIAPTSGTIVVEGEDIAGVDQVLLRRHIGYVFQGIGLFPHLTVAENVSLVPTLLGWSRDEREARVDELLGLVNLDPTTYRSRAPSELSGGQRQRVGIAQGARGPTQDRADGRTLRCARPDQPRPPSA